MNSIHHWLTPCWIKKVKVKSFSPVWLFATLWTVAHQAPPSMGFSRHEYWSGFPLPSPGESSWPRVRTLVSHISGRHFNLWATREAHDFENKLPHFFSKEKGKWTFTEEPTFSAHDGAMNWKELLYCWIYILHNCFIDLRTLFKMYLSGNHW